MFFFFFFFLFLFLFFFFFLHPGVWLLARRQPGMRAIQWRQVPMCKALLPCWKWLVRAGIIADRWSDVEHSGMEGRWWCVLCSLNSAHWMDTVLRAQQEAARKEQVPSMSCWLSIQPCSGQWCNHHIPQCLSHLQQEHLQAFLTSSDHWFSTKAMKLEITRKRPSYER